jgi:titin
MRLVPRRRASARPALRLEELECRLAPATFTVSNASDSGAGSLRQALLDSNATPGLNSVRFNIPGAGVHTIQLLAPLPFITDPVVLDGATQPGYAGSPLINLFGSAAGAGANGLVVTAGGTLIQGLAINGFGGGDGILLAQGGGDVVAADFVGTDPKGMSTEPNAFGVVVAGGGADQVGGNLISNNLFYGVTLFDTAGDVVAGNLIGINRSGSAALPNRAAGIALDGAAVNNVVAGNVIAGNGAFGVLLADAGTRGNTVYANYVGLVPPGAPLANGFAGVALASGAAGNTVGGPTPASRNFISGNGVYGVYVTGAGTTNNVIESDYVGTDPSGTHAAGNGTAGVVIQDGASANLVAVDVISGNAALGVLLQGAGTSGNVVASCLIGSNAAGNRGLANGSTGVLVQDAASGNQVNSDLVTANPLDVLFTPGATGNVVRSSYIGTDLAGATVLPGSNAGVWSQAKGNTVGGATRALGNLIAGCNVGVELSDGGNAVRNNLIGTDATGNNLLGNGTGVFVEGGVRSDSGSNLVVANVISGSINEGVLIDGFGTGNVVQGNFIGTNAAGTTDLPNATGVRINSNSTGNTVGGTTAAARNVISGNTGAGVFLFGPTGTVVEGNYIGTAADGRTPLGNGGQGVFITVSAHENTVGGTAAGAGNVIAFNGDDGVLIGAAAGDTNPLDEAAGGNTVLGNSIYGNGKVGIDLGPDDGVTANGTTGPGSPNVYLIFPVLTAAYAAGNSVVILGNLPTSFVGPYRVEFFANPKADASGHGQGQTFLGFVTATVFNNHQNSFAAVLSASLSPGEVVSATATDQFGNTSEFSADFTFG